MDKQPARTLYSYEETRVKIDALNLKLIRHFNKRMNTAETLDWAVDAAMEKLTKLEQEHTNGN